ncbi:MAG: hypothetical protein ACRD9Q_03435 [Nitrososphaeraceae archaeon]
MYDWMQTYSGKKFILTDPRPEDIDIVDIAMSLTRMCRFNAHCLKFYSVAEHSIFVQTLVTTPHLKLPALLHDAHEAYLGDIIRPIKGYIAGRGIDVISTLSKKLDDCIAKSFGFNSYLFDSKEIINADLVALATEKRDNMAPLDWDTQLPDAHKNKLEFLNESTAFTTFMSLCNCLCGTNHSVSYLG